MFHKKHLVSLTEPNQRIYDFCMWAIVENKYIVKKKFKNLKKRGGG